MSMRFWFVIVVFCSLPLLACGQGDKARLEKKAPAKVSASQVKAPAPTAQTAPPTSDKPSTAAVPSDGQPMGEEQKILYALGVSIMRSLMPFSLTDKELDWVQQGMRDGLVGELEINPTPYEEKINGLADSRVGRVVEVQKKRAAVRVEKEAKMPGARLLESGLIFRSIKPGTGATPGRKSLVTVHYQGALVDGTVFDSSYERDEPTNFPLDQVIPCWTEALQLMKVGGKAHLVCPSQIAYGTSGAPPAIPPGATLFFEVELLKAR